MKELQKRGISKAKKRGVYKNHGRKHGQINKKNKGLRQQAKYLKNQGMKISEIARTLGTSRPTIYAWLKEENSNG